MPRSSKFSITVTFIIIFSCLTLTLKFVQFLRCWLVRQLSSLCWKSWRRRNWPLSGLNRYASLPTRYLPHVLLQTPLKCPKLIVRCSHSPAHWNVDTSLFGDFTVVTKWNVCFFSNCLRRIVMLRLLRRSGWRSRREGEEKRKREGCNSKEKLSSKRKRHPRGLQPGPLLKATSLI